MSFNVQDQALTYKGMSKRHWSSRSQPFAPAEVLVNRLEMNWQPDSVVQIRLHHYGPGRSVSIYHFTLTNGGETVQLPVQSNPVVRRIIGDRQLQVIPTK